MNHHDFVRSEWTKHYISECLKQQRLAELEAGRLAGSIYNVRPVQPEHRKYKGGYEAGERPADADIEDCPAIANIRSHKDDGTHGTDGRKTGWQRDKNWQARRNPVTDGLQEVTKLVA